MDFIKEFEYMKNVYWNDLFKFRMQEFLKVLYIFGIHRAT